MQSNQVLILYKKLTINLVFCNWTECFLVACDTVCVGLICPLSSLNSLSISVILDISLLRFYPPTMFLQIQLTG